MDIIPAFHVDYIKFKREMQSTATYTEDQTIQLFSIFCAEMRHYGEPDPEPEMISDVRPMIVFVPTTETAYQRIDGVHYV